MTPEFLNQYQVAVDKAGKLGMKLCLYDEFWFPSGSAGGLLAKQASRSAGKRLDMLAADVTRAEGVHAGPARRNVHGRGGDGDRPRRSAWTSRTR